MKFSTIQKSVSELMAMRNNINFDTKFQRGFTWKPKNKKYFMDTVRRNWKTSKLVFWETKKDHYSCVDGQQRLKTIFSFITTNAFALSKNSPENFSDKTFEELRPIDQDKIKGYIFDILVISKASINDVSDFFIRLQMGVPLNAAEKLNAILGDVRDFVSEVALHSFFEEKIPLRDYRFSHRYLAAQIVLVAKNHTQLTNLKYSNLKEMYDEKIEDETKDVIKKRLDFLAAIFPQKAKYIQNRATVISLFYFVVKEFDSLSLSQNGATLQKFLKSFQNELYRQKKLKENLQDSEFQNYLLRVYQAADTSSAILARHNFLRNKYLKFKRDGKI